MISNHPIARLGPEYTFSTNFLGDEILEGAEDLALSVDRS